MISRLTKWFKRIQIYVDRPWYLPLVGLFAALDAVLVIFPIETLMIPAILSKPRRWIAGTLWASFGSTLGAFGLAGLIRWDKEFITGKLFNHLFHSHGWQHAVTFVENHGALALGLIAAGPLPQQPAVAIAALTSMPMSMILLAVLIGRMLKYGVVSYLASHMPRIFRDLAPERPPDSPQTPKEAGV